MVRRVGSPTSFWNNAAVLSNGTSNVVELPRGGEQLAIFVTTSATTNITVQVAHHGALTPEGNEPDHSTLPSTWFNLYYIDTPCVLTFSGAGSQVILIPDFEPNWVRLLSSGAATITAGHEITGE